MVDSRAAAAASDGYIVNPSGTTTIATGSAPMEYHHAAQGHLFWAPGVAANSEFVFSFREA